MSARKRIREPHPTGVRGLLSLEGVDPSRIHREWQMTNTLWSLVQRVVALVLLAATAPLLLLLYVPVRLSSRAPFFFRQRRRGFLGREFEIIKITTMRSGSDRVAAFEKGVALSDPAVTPIGRLLRDTKLDELPQLWNVVRGEMEFVGPRPIAPGLDGLLCERIPGFASRYLVKPGLTNLGQVSVLDNALGEGTLADWEVRFEAEKHYIDNKSIFYDLILMAMTAAFMARKLLRWLAPADRTEVAPQPRSSAPPAPERRRKAS